MEKEVLSWLEDIKQAIDEIEDFLPEQRDFFQFKKDIKREKQLKGT